MDIRSRVALVVLLVSLIPSAWLAWNFRAMPQAGIYHDDVIYFVSAKAVAATGYYRIESFPDQPYQTKYPPLYPLLLSFVWRFDPDFPGNLVWVVLLSWLMLPLFLALAWFHFRLGGFLPVESWLLCVLLAINPVVVMFSTLMMSELLFCVLLSATILAAERDQPVRAGFLGGLAFITRTAALPLLLTVPLVYLFRRRFREASYSFLAMFAWVAGWLLWAHAYRLHSTDPLVLFYTDYLAFYRQDVSLSEIPALAWDNVGWAVKAIGELFIFDEGTGFLTVTMDRLLTIAAVIGIVRVVRSGRFTQFTAFGTLYVVQFLVWNYPPNSRFLLPLVPLLYAGLASEAKHLFEIIAAAFRKPQLADRGVAAVISLLLASVAAYGLYLCYFGSFLFLPQAYRQHQFALNGNQDAYSFIKQSVPVDARVLSYSDPLTYLYTGRRGHSWRFLPGLLRKGGGDELARELSRLPEIVRSHQFDYVLYTQSDFHLDAQEITHPPFRAALDNRALFEPVFTSTHATVFKVVRGTEKLR